MTIPTETFLDADLERGAGLEATIGYDIAPALAVYAGWDWQRFEQTEGVPVTTDVEDTGYAFGIRYSPRLSGALGPWLRVAAIYDRRSCPEVLTSANQQAQPGPVVAVAVRVSGRGPSATLRWDLRVRAGGGRVWRGETRQETGSCREDYSAQLRASAACRGVPRKRGVAAGLQASPASWTYSAALQTRIPWRSSATKCRRLSVTTTRADASRAVSAMCAS